MADHGSNNTTHGATQGAPGPHAVTGGPLRHAASLVPVGAFAGKPAMPLTRGVIVVGSGKHSRMLLKSDSVSTTHTLLLHTAAGWYFRDLVSRTHTILNGKSQREADLRDGDTLTIGAFVFHFVSVGHPAEVPPAPAAAMEVTGAEIPVPIDTRTVLIGRRVGCEVRLIEDSVSLVHAVIYEVDGVHYIRDLYSRTGTYLNGKKVHQEPLKFGDIVVVGETTIAYIADRVIVSDGEDLSDAENLSDAEPLSLAAEPAEPAPPTRRPATPEPIGIRAALPPGLSSILDARAFDARVPVETASVPVEPLGVQDDATADAASAEADAAEAESAGVGAADDDLDARTAEDLATAEDRFPAEIGLADERPVLPLGRREAFGDADVIPDVVAEAEAEADAPALANRPIVAEAADPQPHTLQPVEPFTAEPEIIEAEVVEPGLAAAEPVVLEVVEPVDVVDAPPTITAHVDVELPLTEPSVARSPFQDALVADAPAEDAPVESNAAEASPDAIVDPDVEPDVDLYVEPALAFADLAEPAAPAAPVADEPPPAVIIPQDMSELAQLQLRIREALTDPSTLLSRPIAEASDPAAPPAPFEMSQSARRARAIAQLLEGHEEIEEEAERESNLIPFESPDVEAAAPAMPPIVEPPLGDVVIDVAEARPLPEEAADTSVDVSSGASAGPPREVLGERLTVAASLAESVSPGAIDVTPEAAPMPAAAALSVESDSLALASGASAVAGDEADAALASPTVDDASAEPADDGANAEAVVGSASDATELTPVADVALPTEAIVVDAPAAESAMDAVAEPVVDDAIGTNRRGRKPRKPPATKPSAKPIVPKPASPRAATRSRKGPKAAASLTEAARTDAARTEIASTEIASTEFAPAEVASTTVVVQSVVAAESTGAVPTIEHSAAPDVALETAPDTASDVAPAIDADAHFSVEPYAEPHVAVDAFAAAAPIGTTAPIEAALPDAVTAPSESSGDASPTTIAEMSDEAVEADLVEADRAQADLAAHSDAAAVAAADASLAAAPLAFDATPSTLDGIAHAAQPASLDVDGALHVDDVIVPTRLAEEPGELAVEQSAQRGPIELDASQAGEFIATEPRTIDAVEVEAVSPMFDPDAGSIAERDALDGTDAVLAADAADAADAEEAAKIASAPAAAVAPVIVLDEDDEAVSLERQTRPLIAADEHLLDDDELSSDGSPFAGTPADAPVTLLPGPSADAVASSLETVGDLDAFDDETPSALEPATPEAEQADRNAGEADDSLVGDPLREAEPAPAPSHVAFVSGPSAAADAPHVWTVDAARAAEDDLESLLDDGSPLAEATAAVEGASLVAPDATAELAPAEADPYATEVIAGRDELLSAGAPADAAREMEVTVTPAEADAAAPLLIDEPAALDGSTLANVASLALDTGIDVGTDADNDALADGARDVIGRIGFDGSDLADDEEASIDDAAIDGLSADDTGERGAVKSIEEELAGAPRPPVPPESIAVRSSRPTSVLNVKVPTLEELEASFNDAFADALAMADGASFAKPRGDREVARAADGDAGGAAEAAAAVTPAPVAPRPAAPKWELDESLLDQANAAGPTSSMSGGMNASAAFMSLGGIGWIGDDAADEYESLPGSAASTHFPSGPQPLRGGLVPRRESRRRRPVPNASVSDASVPSDAVPVQGEARAAEDEIDLDALAPLHGDAIGVIDAKVNVKADANIDAGPPPALAVDAEAFDQDALPSGLATFSPAVDDDAVSPFAGTPEAFVDDRPAAPPMSTPPVVAPSVSPPLTLPPRPVRRGRQPADGLARAASDDSLDAGASASPFAEQTLPLVDAFSQAAPAGLDEMLARLGAAEGKVLDHPPITQDLPAGGSRGTASPFASQVPFASLASVPADGAGGGVRPSPGVRRVRHQLNKLPILLTLMVGLLGVAAMGAWYWPVPVALRAEVLFTNLNKLDPIERQLRQGTIRDKLVGLDRAARAELDDRFAGDGFLERPEQYAALVERARFDAYNPNLLLFEHTSSVNQAENDKARLNALVRAFVTANRDLVDAKRKLDDRIAALERAGAQGRERVAQLNREYEANTSVYNGSPGTDALRKLERDLAALDAARRAAVQALDEREAALKRLEADPLARLVAPQLIIDESAQLTDVGQALPATRPAEGAAARLAALSAEREAARVRLAQLLQSQAPEAREARERFDESMTAFAADVETARKSLGDRPEVLQYVESARRLQGQIRDVTDTLVRRQQQQLTRLDEFKRQLAELTESTRDERLNNDPQLKQWGDRLAFAERQLNAAKEANAPAADVATIEADVSLLRNMIAGKRETLNDPRASNVTRQLEEMMRLAQREMAADRSANEALLGEVQAAFRRQQPAVEALPDDQKLLSEALAARLAQVDLARQRYTDSLAVSAGGDAQKISELQARLATLDESVAQAQATADADGVAQAAEMERRAAAAAEIEAARQAVATARAARDEAVAQYEAKRRAVEQTRERVEAGALALQKNDDVKGAIAIATQENGRRIAEAKKLIDERENLAVLPPERPGEAYALDPGRTDPRLLYGAAGVGAVLLCFAPLIVRESRHRGLVAAATRPVIETDAIPTGAHAA